MAKRKKKEPVPPSPTDLVHCTVSSCGRMHKDAGGACPSCGNTDSQRALKHVGVPIYMTENNHG